MSRLQNTVLFKFLSLIHILFQYQKVSFYKIPLLIVSKNCIGKQFTYKFLGVSSTNGSMKNVLYSKSILIIV